MGECADLSKKEIWTKLHKGLPHFSSLGTFYKHTKGRDTRDYVEGLFQHYRLADVLRLIGVKDDALEANLQEVIQLKSDADKLFYGR